jgi:hypothetical protein
MHTEHITHVFIQDGYVLKIHSHTFQQMDIQSIQ